MVQARSGLTSGRVANHGGMVKVLRRKCVVSLSLPRRDNVLVNHERRLLTKAADAVAGRISVKRERDRSWPGDHSRLCALQSQGDVKSTGEQAGPHLGGMFATWQITEAGRARLEELIAQPSPSFDFWAAA